MKQDFDRAFPATPDYIASSIELGFRKGRKTMLMRRKITSALSVAACVVVVLAMTAFAATQLTAPKPDVLSSPKYTAEPMPEPISVYATKASKYFHLNSDCGGMQNPTVWDLSAALVSNKQPCPTCTAQWDVFTLPPDEIFFHTNAACADLQPGSESMNIAEAIEASLSPCLRCATNALKQDRFFYATEKGVYFHTEADCSGMENATKRSLPEVLEMGKQACPVCTADISLYAAANGRYFHLKQVCNGQQNKNILTLAEALEQGMSPCPACALGNANTPSPTAIPTLDPRITPIPEQVDMVPLDPSTPTPMPTAMPTLDPRITPIPEQMDMVPLDPFTPTPMPTPEPTLMPERTGWAPRSGKSFPIYTAEDNHFVHTDPSCSGMENAQEYAIEEILGMGKGVCSVCGAQIDAWIREEGLLCLGEPTPEPDPTVMPLSKDEISVWFTPGGTYYHLIPDCSGMQNAQQKTLYSALVNYKVHCPVCIGDNTDIYWLPVPTADEDQVYLTNGNDYFHINPECFDGHGIPTPVITLGDVLSWGRQPCLYCLPEMAYASDDENSDAGAIAILGNDGFYHLDGSCPDEPQHETTVLIAQANGYLRCPVCAATEPEAAELFRTAFGGWLTDLFPDRVFECARSLGQRTTWSMHDGESVSDVCDYITSESGKRRIELNMFMAGMDSVFLHNMPEPLFSLYHVEALPKVHPDAQLYTMIVTFDDGGQVDGCQMEFTNGESWFQSGSILTWMRNAQGEFEPAGELDTGDEWWPAEENASISYDASETVDVQAVSVDVEAHGAAAADEFWPDPEDMAETDPAASIAYDASIGYDLFRKAIGLDMQDCYGELTAEETDTHVYWAGAEGGTCTFGKDPAYLFIRLPDAHDTLIEAFPEPLKGVYEQSRAIAEEKTAPARFGDLEDLNLWEIRVEFDEALEPAAYELYFAWETDVTLRWERSQQGTFERV